MINKYFAKCSIGAGMESYELIEEDSFDKAEELARSLCIDLADSYGFYQNEEYFGELDSVAQEDSWDEDEEEYTNIGFLEYYVEDYNPEEHDDYL